MKGLIFTVLGIALFFVAIVYFFQARFIYFPRSYYSSTEGLDRVEKVEYSVDGKRQFLYLPSRSESTPPEAVWWLFGGNGSVALDWLGLAEAAKGENVGFVLFDYPGYGFNQGNPHPDTIAQSIEAAIPALAEHWGITTVELLRRSRATGHSLGCAVAFNFANWHGVDRVIAISPFTTMDDMARQQMGPLVVPLLRHRYDNETSIDEILASGRDVKITIFHGDADQLIPVSMGRELAARDDTGKKIRFQSVPGVGHNNIIGSIAPALLEQWSQ